MKIPTTDLKSQYIEIKEEIDAAMARVIGHGQFILGQEVKTFEEEIAPYCGTQYATGVASGTEALYLALLACGIGPGDEVLTPAFTFVATVETIVQCGAVPVFIDIDPRTYNINAGEIEAKITPCTKAILPVHLYGQSADMDPIMALVRRYNLRVIEDCAQALGTEYRGRKVGSIGDAGCLSFFPNKNLGAYGDGGMIITNTPEIAERANMLRNHGARKSYYYEVAGFNSRLDAIQAAILSVKLKYLDRWIELRRRNAGLYGRFLNGIGGISVPYEAEFSRHSYNYYTVRLNSGLSRDELRNHLTSRDIGTMVYYPLCLHLQDAYRNLGYRQGDLLESEAAQAEVLSLPMYPQLTQEDIQEVASIIMEFARDRAAYTCQS